MSSERLDPIHRRLATVCAMAALLAPHPVYPATSTSTFLVTTTVLPACSVSSSNVSFTSYAGLLLDATGGVSVTCTNLAVYTVELDAGTGAGASTSTRRMTGPNGSMLNYSLYQDAARTLVWGLAGSLNQLLGVGTGGSQSHVVYARIPALQTPEAGSYSDTITVTLTY